MPNTSNYNFEYESPGSLPGPTLTGGPGGGSPILAQQVDSALLSVDNQTQANTLDIDAINTELDGHAPLYGRVELSGSQLLSTSVTTKIEFNTTVFDPSSLWDAGNFWFEIPADGAGLYSITSCVSYDTGSTNRRMCSIETNTYGRISSEMNNTTVTTNIRAGTATLYTLEPGDTIWVSGFQDSGGSLDVVGSANNATHLAIVRVGPLS